MFFLLILSDNLRWAHTEIKSLSLPWGRTMKRTNQGVLRLNLGLSPLDSQSQIFIYLFIYVWGFFACPLQRCSKQNYCLIFIFLSVLLLYWTTWLSYLEVFYQDCFIYLSIYNQNWEDRGTGKKRQTEPGGQTEILHRPCQAVTRSEPVHTQALSPGRREPPMYQRVGHQPLAGSMVGVAKPPYLGGERSGI